MTANTTAVEQHPTGEPEMKGPFTDVELDMPPHGADKRHSLPRTANTPPPSELGNAGSELQADETETRAPSQPKPAEEPIVLPGGYQVDSNKPMGKALKRAMWAGKKCFNGMEYLGEMFAGLLGITDSRFQWVMDGMTEDDMIAAQQDLQQTRGQPVVLLDEIRQRQESQDASNLVLPTSAAHESNLSLNATHDMMPTGAGTTARTVPMESSDAHSSVTIPADLESN